MAGDPELQPVVAPIATAIPTAQGFTTIWADNSVAAAVMTTPLVTVGSGRGYLQGFKIGGLGATAAAVLTCSISNILNGNRTFYLNVPAGVTTPVLLEFLFPIPIPASTIGGSITINVPSFGAGNTNAWTIAWGFDA